MKTPYSPQWVSEKKTMKNDIWRRSKSFCIWMYMMKYDGYHKEMLFKVLCMQSKLGKHWQWNDKWRNKSENMKQFKNDILLSFSSASAALRISDFACVFLLMFWTRIRCKNLKIKQVYMFFMICSFHFHIFVIFEQRWNCKIIPIQCEFSITSGSEMPPSRGLLYTWVRTAEWRNKGGATKYMDVSLLFPTS